MGFLADLLLAAGAFGAALYCFVLSRRLKSLGSLESGMGGAIALLSAQVDDLTKALSEARQRVGTGREHLDAQAARAEAACQRLELLLASMHDLPAAPAPDPAPDPSSHAEPDPVPREASAKVPADPPAPVTGHRLAHAHGQIEPAGSAAHIVARAGAPAVAHQSLPPALPTRQAAGRARIVRRRRDVESA